MVNMIGTVTSAEEGLSYPFELLIKDTPVSVQTKRPGAKERWKAKVGQLARGHINELVEWYYLIERPLAVTIYYFPPDVMDGDIDNIVKCLLDGMVHIVYPDDRAIERVTVQKFEPGVTWSFGTMTPTLEKAIEAEPPVIYIRIDGDLHWRDVS
jgi:crossover junction endodeoxyribonuclease RusA